MAFDKPSKRTRYHKNNIAAQGERGMESGQKEANGNKEATDVAVNWKRPFIIRWGWTPSSHPVSGNRIPARRRLYKLFKDNRINNCQRRPVELACGSVWKACGSIIIIIILITRVLLKCIQLKTYNESCATTTTTRHHHHFQRTWKSPTHSMLTATTTMQCSSAAAAHCFATLTSLPEARIWH